MAFPIPGRDTPPSATFCNRFVPTQVKDKRIRKLNFKTILRQLQADAATQVADKAAAKLRAMRSVSKLSLYRA